MFTSPEVARRIKSHAKSKGIAVKNLLEACDLNKNTLSNMQSGGFFPRVETIARIADYLDCSVDYLLGRTATPERSGGCVSPALSRLIDAADDLTDEEVEKAVEYVAFLRASRK